MRPEDLPAWTIFVTNDNCPDYTWGFTEEQTRRAMADLVAAHLDLMTRTDGWASDDRNRYNATITQEVLCFLEHYPHRCDELMARVREGRLCVSPFLCNTLWGLQSIEGAIRSLYPARRLEREWGVRFDVAEHIELPSLPWGMATLLAGCGIRWLSIPFLAYDSTFSKLENPPLFRHEGPDGSTVNVVMDPWASLKAAYGQGSHLLQDPGIIAGEWVPHYQGLGEAYPLRSVFASGTHGDLSPESGAQAPVFAQAIAAYNASEGTHPKLVNGTLAQFCRAVEDVRPSLETLRGCFGHSWELWPVSLAKHAADMREGERRFLAVEALFALATARTPGCYDALRGDYELGQWCWAMLAEHAWNGTDDWNRGVNAELRRGWNQTLGRITTYLQDAACSELGLVPGRDRYGLFNALSVSRGDLVCLEAREASVGVTCNGLAVPAQVVATNEGPRLCFVSPSVAGFGMARIEVSAHGAEVGEPTLRATPSGIEGPHYRFAVDQETGGLRSIVHQPSGRELVVPIGRTLGETRYAHDGGESSMRSVTTAVVACGPVLARLRVTGMIGSIACETLITGYAGLDRIDFDFRLEKPPVVGEESLCHVFPVLAEGGTVRVETPAAVIVPRPRPEGDLLAGADPRRFAVQGFLDVAWPGGGGVTIAPHDAFALRLDREPLSIQALGSDQNYKEVSHDQGGVTSFRFRYSLRAYDGGYDQAKAVAWSRATTSPLLVLPGALDGGLPPVTVDAARAIATCLKPAEEAPGEIIMRLWETAGRSGPLAISVDGFTGAVRTDLLEREIEPLPIRHGEVQVALGAHGMLGLRLRR